MDFKNLETDIQELNTEDDFINAFPVFGAYKEFKKEVEQFKKLQIWKYILLLYTPESPLVNKLSEIHKRKIRAMELAGISKNNFEKFDLINNNTDIINKMITRYFKATNNMLFESIVSGQEAFSNLMSIVRKIPDEDRDNSNIGSCFEKAQNIRKMVEELKKEVEKIQVDVFKENISFSYAEDAQMGTMEKIALEKKSY